MKNALTSLLVLITLTLCSYTTQAQSGTFKVKKATEEKESLIGRWALVRDGANSRFNWLVHTLEFKENKKCKISVTQNRRVFNQGGKYKWEDNELTLPFPPEGDFKVRFMSGYKRIEVSRLEKEKMVLKVIGEWGEFLVTYRRLSK